MHVAGLRSSLVFLLQRENTPYHTRTLHCTLRCTYLRQKKKISETKFTGRLALHHDDALEHCRKCVLDCSFTWNSARTQAPTGDSVLPLRRQSPSSTTTSSTDEYEHKHELARANRPRTWTVTQRPNHLRLQQVPGLN